MSATKHSKSQPKSVPGKNASHVDNAPADSDTVTIKALNGQTYVTKRVGWTAMHPAGNESLRVWTKIIDGKLVAISEDVATGATINAQLHGIATSAKDRHSKAH